MAMIYLVVDVHSASVTYSISNETLTVGGTADLSLNIPIEGVWDSLSQGKKHWWSFLSQKPDQLEEYLFIVEYNVSLNVTNLLIAEAGYCRRKESKEILSTCKLILHSSLHPVFYWKLRSWNNCSWFDLVFTLAVHRYPIISSGDTIALRSAYTSGRYSTYWLYCHTSYCGWSTCKGTIMTSSGWASCSKQLMFTITAKGKTDGEPINSGDTVSLKSNHYGGSYRLYCSSSYSSYCCARS